MLECVQNDIIVLFATGNWAHEGEHTSSWTYDVGFDSRAQYFNRNNEIGYPAVFNNVISVAGCTYDREYILSYSSLGPGVGGFDEPDVAAPTHYDHDNPYGYAGGTSAACPFMAGVCALVLDGSNVADSSRMVGSIHSNSVDRGETGFDDEFGYGVVNAMLLYENYNNWVPPPPEEASPLIFLSGVGLVAVGIVFRRKDEIDWSVK